MENFVFHTIVTNHDIISYQNKQTKSRPQSCLALFVDLLYICARGQVCLASGACDCKYNTQSTEQSMKADWGTEDDSRTNIMRDYMLRKKQSVCLSHIYGRDMLLGMEKSNDT